MAEYRPLYPKDDSFLNELTDKMSDSEMLAALHYNDGIDQMEAGRVEEAISLFELAVSEKSDFSLAYNNLGILLAHIGRNNEAEQAFINAVTFDSFFAEAYYNLGLVYEKLGRYSDSNEQFDIAILLNNNYGEAYLEKGNCLLFLEDVYQALESYEKAALLLPKSAIASNNIGMVFLQLEDELQAEKYFREALRYDVKYVPAYNNLSTLLNSMGRVSEAMRTASAGLVYFPDDTRLLSVYAKSLLAQCKIPEALSVLRKILELNPHDAVQHSNLLFTLQYSKDISLEILYSEHLSWSAGNQLHDAGLIQFSNNKEPDRKLVIGYLSPDFCKHPVGFFLTPVLSAHNREYFKVICYSDRIKTDIQTLMLESSSDLWRDTSNCSDQELLELIAADGVDILVDLAGHTGGNRLPLFAQKAAPIQVTWAGYVGTTGLSTMDYLISDSNESPGYADDVTVERIVRLPDGYVCYAPPEYAPEIMPLPAYSNGYITFGCFNNLPKLNEDVIKLWSELLKRIPTSKIFLKTKSFNDQETRERYHQLFVNYGVELERVILEGDSRHPELLASYNRVDIALDPFPYSGGLTTLESLWMGVPVITLGGERFCSRHSLTHLTILGLTETIAADAETYITTALILAENLDHLAAMRSSLRPRMAASPLCNGVKFTRNLEAAYRSMWQAWVSNCVVSIS